jgi:hypothetical protein
MRVAADWVLPATTGIPGSWATRGAAAVAAVVGDAAGDPGVGVAVVGDVDPASSEFVTGR